MTYAFMKYLFSALQLLNLEYFRVRETTLFIYIYFCHISLNFKFYGAGITLPVVGSLTFQVPHSLD